MVVHGCMWTSGVTCASVLLPHEINMPDARPPFTRERPGSRSTTSSAWPRLSGVPLIVESSHRGVAMRAHIHVIASWSILAYPMQAKERKMPRLPTKPTVRRAQAPKHPLATRTVELSGRHHGGPRQVRPRLADSRVCQHGIMLFAARLAPGPGGRANTAAALVASAGGRSCPV
jgi:hypothetical protein